MTNTFTETLNHGSKLYVSACQQADIELFEQALERFEEALVLAETLFGRQSIESATAIRYIGETFECLSNHDEARFFLEEALEIFQDIAPDSEDIPDLLVALGDVYVSQEEEYSALDSYKEALKILERTDRNPLGLSRPILGMAQIYYGQEKYQQAESLFRRGIKLVQNVDGIWPSTIAHHLYFCGRCADFQGKRSEAVIYYKQALSKIEGDTNSEDLKAMILARV